MAERITYDRVMQTAMGFFASKILFRIRLFSLGPAVS
jgi:hypothetical protein